MQTYKEMCYVTALKLGCEGDKVEMVWQTLESYPLALTESSFVNQVANAMRTVGQEPDMTRAERAASDL